MASIIELQTCYTERMQTPASLLLQKTLMRQPCPGHFMTQTKGHMSLSSWVTNANLYIISYI